MHPLERRMCEINEEIWADFLLLEHESLDSELKGSFDEPVIALVEIHGAWEGAVVVETSNDAISSAASAMYGPSVSIGDEERYDVARELANMLGGHIKTMISEAKTEIPCTLSPPTIINQDTLDDRIASASRVFSAAFKSAKSYPHRSYLLKS